MFARQESNWHCFRTESRMEAGSQEFGETRSMKRPLLPVAIVYLGGLLTALIVSVPVSLLFCGTAAFSIASLFVSRFRSILLGLAVFVGGWLNLAVRTAVLSPHDLRSVLGGSIELVAIRGELCRTPVQRAYEQDGRMILRSVAEMEVEEIRIRSITQRASGRVRIATPGILESEFSGGKRAEVYGVLGRPKLPVAIGMFNYREYLRKRGIYYLLTAEGANDWHLIDENDGATAPPISDRFVAWARSNLSKGLVEEDEALRLLWAMVLGWRTALTEEVSEPFMRSGTLHVFAISGLHIALITGILVQLLRVIRVPRPVVGLILVPALWIYACVTGWQASAVRATIMMTVVVTGWALNRPSDLLNSLAAAALIVLIWDPLQLSQASFQLSFCVVLSIALLGSRLDKLLRKTLETDPFLPGELRPSWRCWLDGPIRYLTASLSVSVAAWLGSICLIASYFHLVTPASLLANVLIVPLAAVTLMASLGSLLCGDLLPACTILFNHSAWLWMTLIVKTSYWIASLPGAFYYVESPSAVQVGAYCVVLWACFSGWVFVKKWRTIRIGMFVLILLIGIADKILRRSAIRLTVFPFGGGALFVDSPGSTNDLLIDCGDSRAAERVLKPYFKAHGFDQLPSLLLSHGDIGHVGGFEELTETFGKSRVYTSSIPFRSPVYRGISEALSETPGVRRFVSRGDAVAGWTVLYPGLGDKYARADDSAIVLRGEFWGLRVLMVSDLGRLGQRRLMERENDLRADIIVAGLPTRDEALIGPFLEAVQPRLVVVASGEFPASNRASRSLRRRIRDAGCSVVYTDEVGAVTMIISEGIWEARTSGAILAFGDLPPSGFVSEVVASTSR